MAILRVSFNLNMRKFITFVLSIMFLSISSGQVIQAQENNINDSQQDESLDSSEDQETNESLNDESASQEISISFEEFVPYANFTNYQYQGDQVYFDAQDIIMEYSPDSNGIFQVTSFSGQEAIAYVYQIRDTGFYELASFNDYYVVEDLRYSPEASDNDESLILPSNLTIGSSFSSGYNNEKRRMISELISSYDVGGQTFNDVLRIEEQAQEDSGPVTYNYYYAPTVGIIVIERTASDGTTQRVLQLISAQGSSH